MEKVSVYKTTDDETFENKTEAQAHQNISTFKSWDSTLKF